ncbi:mitochondrial import inner membrane translocase subunit Tim8 [Episyrphus balteatus]|uniref:mitochondrial import inner membrane translocase subunit Tim8 n=1 Tax=Episyrphus balteatus TaxID=286459 RepID=UPI002485D575|nr:mitochondrial import inner membrane translocase subunit Tim8 [Episyrphus balteatus]
MSDFESINATAGNQELKEMIMAENQKAQATAHVHEFNEICWDKCVSKPGSKLDSSTETCLTNCVERFIDTSIFVAKRFADRLQKTANGL